MEPQMPEKSGSENVNPIVSNFSVLKIEKQLIFLKFLHQILEIQLVVKSILSIV